ncbi:MAG TPA: hypothetical protein VGT40_08795 [Methylomirabilota bacterium]|jgi:hypothetical protein|nr:hypothetical protein [Methylomirabilota bacterium]
MHEDKVAEIQSYLVRHLPDCRITNHYDFDHEAQRFKVRHGRMATHTLLVEEGGIDHNTTADLNRLLDRAINHLRLTAPQVQVRIGRRGVTVEQIVED